MVLGGAPNAVEQPQKIFDLVRSWLCTSSPITASYFSLLADISFIFSKDPRRYTLAGRGVTAPDLS